MADTSFLEASWAMLFDKDPQSIPNGEIPIKAITKKGLEYAISHDDLILYRLGHSTILMGLEGRFWLFDPIFSERASPFQWIGPKRFHPTPIDIENLPPLAGVIISHNHYDHLDEESIKALADKTERFYIPLGNKEFLKDWGVGVDKIYEMGWWDSLKDQDTTIIGTPTQHFSGRSLSDRNETLWMSWVLQTDQHSIYFSGDSGYFDGFKEIGKRYGPFDVTMMENGAYNVLWPDVHMRPKETVQAHIDLNGKLLLPIHNGTFDLSTHAWQDPLMKVRKYAEEMDVELATPIIGERVVVEIDHSYSTAWWEKVVHSQ